MEITRYTPVGELPELLDVEEFRTWLGIGRSLAYDMLRRHEVPAIKIGRLVRIPRSALIDWPYKLHIDANEGRGKKKLKGARLRVLLYDLSKDPNETTDLAAQQPEQVAKMKAELSIWKESVERSHTGADYSAATNP